MGFLDFVASVKATRLLGELKRQTVTKWLTDYCEGLGVAFL